MLVCSFQNRMLFGRRYVAMGTFALIRSIQVRAVGNVFKLRSLAITEHVCRNREASRFARMIGKAWILRNDDAFVIKWCAGQTPSLSWIHKPVLTRVAGCGLFD